MPLLILSCFSCQFGFGAQHYSNLFTICTTQLRFIAPDSREGLKNSATTCSVFLQRICVEKKKKKDTLSLVKRNRQQQVDYWRVTYKGKRNVMPFSN